MNGSLEVTASVAFNGYNIWFSYQINAIHCMHV